MKRTVVPLILLVCLLPLVSFGQTPTRVAILELKNEAGITESEAYYLTDKVRDAASRVLARRGFLVITRESLQELLPPGTDLASCTTAECEVEVGRTIGADYIVTGEIIKYGVELRANLKAHHSGSGAFLGAEACKGKNLNDLEESIANSSLLLFNKVLAHAAVGGGAPTQPGIQPGAIGESSTGGWELPTASQVVVRFESDPPGAVVLVDGQLKCQATPCGKALGEGAVNVSMQRERYQARQEMVQVKQGMPAVSWKLDPNFGWLSVESNPSGLSVKINGEAAGTTPLQNKDLDPGAYEVLVSDPRYYDQGERINLAAGERKTISVTLPPREGGIQVSAQDQAGNDLSGEVYLDGNKVGSAPGSFKAMIGRHKIEVKTPQGSWSGTVEIKERAVTPVAAEVKVAAAPATPSRGAASRGSVDGMASIAAGWFQMGCSPGDSECEADEKPSKRVYVDSFSMDAHEVTQADYQRVMGKNPSSFKNCPNCPVETVSWDDAKSYCAKVGKRLPTEAEWEYAARSGMTGARYGDIDVVAWYRSNSGNKTHPVGQKQPNAYGLYDMLGNVWEWCADGYDKKWYSRMPERNPRNDNESQYRVLRGGSWSSFPWYARASGRFGYLPSGSYNSYGFRCVGTEN